MIITKTWLNEYLDLADISNTRLINSFNASGIEVAKHHYIRVADEVVVAQILKVTKIENSDKLHLCLLDIGQQQLEVVCGAKNVEADAFVALAMIGAKIGDMKIKATKLRGVASKGMICSAKELGLPATEEGIMILDDSIGELELGKPLNEYALFNDFIIELELTPNRGDCLSVHGLARDASAALDLELKAMPKLKKTNDNQGIGRLISLRTIDELESELSFMAIKLDDSLKSLNLKLRLRLAMLEKLSHNTIEDLVFYSSYASGVVFCAYDFDKLCKNCKQDDKIMLDVVKKESKITELYFNKTLINVPGIQLNESFKSDEHTKTFIIEASYTQPKLILDAALDYDKKDECFFRSQRGSEPDLNLGIAVFSELLSMYKQVYIYSGIQQVRSDVKHRIMNLDLDKIQAIIGKEIDKNEALKKLKSLGFEMPVLSDEQISICIPNYRQDIENTADIAEELVRLIGIDNIDKKPLEFTEKPRQNPAYESYIELKALRQRAAHTGYFESIFYVMDNEASLKELGFNLSKNQLLNPISSELGVLRPSIINQLLKASSFNLKNYKKKIKLFSIGAVFDENLCQRQVFSMIYTGYKEEAKQSNKAKPALIDFFSFLEELKNIIGEFELGPSKLSFLSPYEQASIYKNKELAGFVGRVHLATEKKRELLKSYVCELDLLQLRPSKSLVNPYSKYPSSTKDLCILVPKNYDYNKIRSCVKDLKLATLREFKLVDIFSDESLGDKNALTLSFVFQAMDATLEEAQINTMMDELKKAFSNRLDLHLRS